MHTWHVFSEFMQTVESCKKGLNLREYQDCFFRGHPDSAYKLQPSLFRHPRQSDGEYWKVERRSFFEFRTRARQLYSVEHSDWDVLFHMQHHGVPTRLLDWTSVFGVALYFALLDHHNNPKRIPCIWMLNPYVLNHAIMNVHRLFNVKYLAREESLNRSYSFSELLIGTCPPHWKDRGWWRTPIAIYENQRSERMFAQNGWFTIHGYDLRPIEEIFKDTNGILAKVEVPTEAIPAAREFLALAGIGHQQLFPDLDGIARSVCEKFHPTARSSAGISGS